MLRCSLPPPGLGAVTTCGDTGRRPPRTARPAPRSSCAAARPAACPEPAGPPGRPRGRSSASPGNPGAERGRPAAWIRAMPACGACERQRDDGEPWGALPVLPPFAPSRDAVDVRGQDSPEGIRQHVAPIEGVDGAPRGGSSLALQEGAPGASQQLALGTWGGALSWGWGQVPSRAPCPHYNISGWKENTRKARASCGTP